jgi:hypothetical protein
MPVARGPRFTARSALLVGGTGVFVALVLLGLVLFLVNRSDSVKVRLGDQQFQDLDAERAARNIADKGPLLFSDVSGGGRDIFVQHLGADPKIGWLAFNARPPGESRNCFLQWSTDSRHFTDNGRCSRSFTFPADGGDLVHYPATVNDAGKVIVDLNATSRSTTTLKGT